MQIIQTVIDASISSLPLLTQLYRNTPGEARHISEPRRRELQGSTAGAVELSNKPLGWSMNASRRQVCSEVVAIPETRGEPAATKLAEVGFLLVGALLEQTLTGCSAHFAPPNRSCEDHQLQLDSSQRGPTLFPPASPLAVPFQQDAHRQGYSRKYSVGLRSQLSCSLPSLDRPPTSSGCRQASQRRRFRATRSPRRQDLTQLSESSRVGSHQTAWPRTGIHSYRMVIRTGLVSRERGKSGLGGS